MPKTVKHFTGSNTDALPWGMPGHFPPLPLRHGYLRGPVSTLGVNSDAEAVAAWVAEKGAQSHKTATAYRREAERLLLWACIERDKALSELTREDILAYRQFLNAPYPTERWIAQNRAVRKSPHWRPFRAPLSEKSAYYALTIVYGLFSFLHSTGWIQADPAPMPKTPPETRGAVNRKALSDVAVDALRDAIENLPHESPGDGFRRNRWRFVVELFLCSACRIDEAAAGNTGQITGVVVKGKTVRVWASQGKGRKEGLKPLSRRALRALEALHLSMGLNPDLSDQRPIPLVPSFRSLKAKNPDAHIQPISANQLYSELKDIFWRAASTLSESYPDDAKQLSRATPHTLRHTALTRMADMTQSMRLVQMLGNHSSIKTSAIYTSPDLADLVDAVSGLD